LISNLIFLCKLTIVIPQLSCLFKMVNAVSSTIVLLNLVTSEAVNSVNFAMKAFASKRSPLSCSNVLMDGEELDDKRYI